MKKLMLLLSVVALTSQVLAAEDQLVTASVNTTTLLTTQTINFGVPFTSGVTVADTWGTQAQVQSVFQNADTTGQNVTLTWGAKNSSHPLLVNIDGGGAQFPFEFYAVPQNTAWSTEDATILVDGAKIITYGTNTGTDYAYVYINALVPIGTTIPSSNGSYSHTATLVASSGP